MVRHIIGKMRYRVTCSVYGDRGDETRAVQPLYAFCLPQTSAWPGGASDPLIKKGKKDAPS